MAKNLWTHGEKQTLTMAIGAFGADYLCRNLPGRTLGAIYAKVRSEFGAGGISRGTKSLREAARQTGYDIDQLRRAGVALRQRWTRTSRGARVMLSDEQIEVLVQWLGHDYWCKRSRTYACVSCGRNDRR